MWEGLVRAPRGRISLRQYILVAATLLVAFFGYVALAPTAHAAANATWKNDSLQFKGNTYHGPTIATTGNSLQLPVDTPYYTYTQPVAGSGSTQKAFVIYFAPGADPPTETSAQYVTYSVVRGNYTSKSNPQTINVVPAPPAATGNSSCQLDGIGWIVCPVSKALAEGMDYLYGVITQFFEVSPLTTTNGNLYAMWNIFRNIANILFVVGFLIVIYGQISGGLLDNYTIKKILPRFVVAALLVNVSYWICSIGVDISNILGYSVQDLFNHLRDVAGAPNTSAGSGIPTWASVTTAILAGGGAAIAGASALVIAAGTVTGLALLLLSALIPVIFAAFIAVAVLAARQALITILVIIAPLAFVAYLLPNTDEWFTRWRKLFMNMLIMFPAFSLIFGGAQLAGTLIIQNTDSIVVVILGMTVQVVPLFITPFLIKLSSGLMTTIANLTNDKSKGIFDRTKNWADNRRPQEQALGRMRRDRRAKEHGFIDGRAPGRNRFTRGAKRLHPYNMAYRRDYRRREREGLKSAHEAMSEGLFSQTAAGARIHDTTKDAGLEKHYGEAINSRRWNAAVYGNPRTGAAADPYRSHLHHAAHMESGEAKLIEDRATAHAERDLQTSINANAALRDLKIQTDVDTAHAKLQSDHIEGDAKLAFQTEVDNDRALKLMKVATYVAEQQASSIDTRLTKNAEARWNQLSRTDAHLQELRLREVQASAGAEISEAQWKNLVIDLQTNADAAKGYIAGDVNLANSLKSQQQTIAIEGNRSDSLKIKQKTNLAKAFKDSEALRMRAGADTQEGATRVYAQAVKEVVNAAVEEVKVNRSLMSEMTQTQLQKLLYEGKDDNNDPVTDEMRQAAMYELLQERGNNEDAQEIRDAVAKMGLVRGDDGNYYEPHLDSKGRVLRDREGKPIADPRVNQKVDDPAEVERRRTWQQFFIDAAAGSKHSMITRSGSNNSEFKSGTSLDTTRQGFMRDLLSGKFSAKKVLDADIDELKILLEDLRSSTGEYSKLTDDERKKAGDTLLASILKLQRDPMINSQIDERNRGFMNEIAAEIDSRYRINPNKSEKGQFYINETGALIRTDQTDEAGEVTVFTAPLTLNKQQYTDRTIENV